MKRDKPLIRHSAAAAAAVFSVVLALAVPAASVAAEVTFGLAAGSFSGVRGSVVGDTHIGGAPLPFVDFDARLRDVEVHAEGVPYVRTRQYGDPFDPARSTIDTGDVTVRLYTSPQLSFGVGYGVIASTTDHIAPPGSFTSFAGGVRLELHERLDVTPNGRLELTFGGLPRVHGTLHVYPGVPGARDRYDPEAGTQVDAEIRYLVRSRGLLSLGYGLRYVDQAIVYARSSAPLERNTGILPFVELDVRL